MSRDVASRLTFEDGCVLANTFLAGVQMEIGEFSGGTGDVQLNINYNNFEESDWELHSVLIWDSALSTATMKAVTAALREVSSLSLSCSLPSSLSIGFPGAARCEALLRRTRTLQRSSCEA